MSRKMICKSSFSLNLNNLQQQQSNKEVYSNSLTVFSFKGLKPEMFAHPLDAQITKQLSRIPFLETFARRLYSFIEQAYVVENLGSSILAGPQQMPMLHKSLILACKILDIEVPELYVKQNPTPNAYTLAFMGRKPFIVVHTGSMQIFLCVY
jgi:Zn-dependent protease with chaperone function